MPTIPSVEKTIDYRVGEGSNKIVIHAKVGAAQRGVPVALFVDDGTFLAATTLPDSTEEFDAAVGSSLIGRVIRVQTLITDTNPHINLTIVNYEISGGLQEVKDNTQQDAQQAGGRVAHFFSINFKA